MHDIGWGDYQAFLAIARHGQLARAARASGVDATTMGRRLRRLESRLGTSLFEQTREGQQLTEAGEALLAAVETMAQAAAVIRESGGAGGGIAGTVRLSVSEGFGTWVIAPEVADLHRRYPGLTLDLVASSGFLSPSRREADIAVMLSRPKAGPVVARRLSDYALRLYAGADYLAQAGVPTTPEDLARDHRLIGYIPDLLYAPELRYLSEVRPDLALNARSSSITAQYRMISAGAGIGVLPCFIGDADPALVPLLPEVRITRTFWLVTHRDTQTVPRVRAVKDWLVEVARGARRRLVPEA